MSSMVYLLTSLPALTFAQVPPISLSEFYNDAAKQLSQKRYNQLSDIDIRSSGKIVQRQFKSIENLLSGIAKDIAEMRLARNENRLPKTEFLSHEIMNANPLEREQEIMKRMWDELESIEVGKTFTFTEVVVYKLKLQVLIRLNSFNKKRGAEVLASVVNPNNNEED